MKRILLVCNGGFSTSMLMAKMKDIAIEKNIAVEIEAVAETDAEDNTDFSIMLLGPQIGHRLNEFSETMNIPVYIIDSYDYGTMNGAAVLEFALAHIGE